MLRSDLPFGSEFSPSQIDLGEVLDFAKRFGGDWKAFEDAIRVRYFDSHSTSEYNRRKLANNCKLGMIAYQIIDRNAKLTSFGENLWELHTKPDELHALLARHILLHLRGLAFIQTVQDIEARGESVDLNKLRGWLSERGIHFPRGGKHPSIMRLWLEKAGLFAPGTWRVNEARLEELSGAASDDMEQLAGFTAEQKAYLKTLSNVGGPGPYSSNEVEKLAATTYGVKFNEKNLPKDVLYPLQAAGYIALTRGTKVAGRDAKPFQVTPTEKLIKSLIAPLLEALEQQTDAELRPLLRRSLREILTELKSANKYIRGHALEALAFYLMRLVGLNYVITRLRPGKGVQVFGQRSQLFSRRWQFFCTSRPVTEDEVATEVGLMNYFGSHALCIVTTKTFLFTAKRYVEAVGRLLPGAIVVMIDRKLLEEIAYRPLTFIESIISQAPFALVRIRES